MTAAIKKIFLQPILLFFVAGIGLYILYLVVSGLAREKDNVIVVSTEQIEFLRASFEKTWNRVPTDAEMKAQIDNFIMDEVFFKEAVAMGLDKKDQAVKRRMRQIMEMMLDDFTTVYPTESQLQQYLSENSQEFRLPSRITFDHIYFKQDEKIIAAEQLDKLQDGKNIDPSINGRMSMIPPHFENETDVEIIKIFGSRFTEEISQSTPGEWVGPVASAYGWHLVKVEEMTEGEVPPLEAVRDKVELEWMVMQRKVMKEKQYAAMKARYEISINYKEQN